ncbi:MAG: Ig-like domain-containing protein [Bacteroidota bacterium]
MIQLSKRLLIFFSILCGSLTLITGSANAQGPIFTSLSTDVNTPTSLFLPSSIIPNQEISVIDPPENGTVLLQSLADLGIDPNDPIFADIELFILYTPDQDFIGTDSLIVEVCDTVALSCQDFGIEVIVGGGQGGNSTLVFDDFFQIQADTASTLDVLANDPGVNLTITSVTQPVFGQVAISGNSILFTPDPGYTGPDNFFYTACDDQNQCEDGHVSLHIESEQTGNPNFPDDTLFGSFNIPGGQPFYIYLPDFVIANQQLTIIEPPSNGTGEIVALDSVGVDPNDPAFFGVSELIAYTPDQGFIGTDTMTVMVIDSIAMDTVYLILEYIVDGSSPDFFASDDHFTVSPDVPTILDVLANDFGTDLVITATTAPLNGTIDLDSTGTVLTYTPDPGFTGTDNFIYTVCNPVGCLDAYVDITVGNTSIPFEINLITEENLPVSFSSMDIIGFPATGPVTVITSPSNGTLSIDNDVLTYTPNNGFIGNDTIQLNACYAEFGVCFDISIIIEVLPAGASFDIVDDNYDVSQDLVANLSVLSNDTGINLTITQLSAPANGQAIIDGSLVAYTPNPGYIGPDSFVYTACDGNGNCADGTVTINVVEYIATTYFTVTTEQNLSVTLNSLDFLGIPFLQEPVILTQPDSGSVVVDDLSLTYTPNIDFTGDDVFLVQICFDSVNCLILEITVIVEPAGSTFVLQDDFVNVVPGSSTQINVFGNDTGNGLSIINNTLPTNGTLVTNGNLFDYTPNSGYTGPDQFAYTACDIYGNCGNATVSIQVGAAGTIFQDITTAMNVPLYIPLEAGLPAGIPVQLIAAPTNGTLEIYQVDTTIVNGSGEAINYPDGLILYTPALDYTGLDVFQIYYELIPGVPELFSVVYFVDVLPTQGGCTDDCVWPGDANNNGLVDVYDLLPIGLTYGETGIARINATTDWIGQAALDWPSQVPDLNINTKFADCDGNGIIEAADTLVILENYNLTHGIPGIMNPIPAPQQITLVSDDTVVSEGEVMEVEIWVGSEAVPTANMYGFAGKFIFDPTIIDAATIQVEMEPGNFLSGNSDMLSLAVNHYNGQLDIAYTRTDGNSASGFGKVGTISFIVTDNIDGLVAQNNGFAPVTSELKLIDTYMMDGNGQMYTIGSDPVVLTGDPATTSVETVVIDTEEISLAPNPANQSTTLRFEQTDNSGIAIVNVYNMLGAIVMQLEGNGQTQLEINTAGMLPGSYVVELITDDGKRGVTKLQVIR